MLPVPSRPHALVVSALLVLGVMLVACSGGDDPPATVGASLPEPTPMLPPPPSGGVDAIGTPTYSPAEQRRIRRIVLAEPWVVEATGSGAAKITRVIPWTPDAEGRAAEPDARGAVAILNLPVPIVGRTELPLREPERRGYPYPNVRHYGEPGMRQFRVNVRLDLGIVTEVNESAPSPGRLDVRAVLPWEPGDDVWDGPPGGDGALAALDAAMAPVDPASAAPWLAELPDGAESFTLPGTSTWTVHVARFAPPGQELPAGSEGVVCVQIERGALADGGCAPDTMVEHGWFVVTDGRSYTVAVVPEGYDAVVDGERIAPQHNVVFLPSAAGSYAIVDGDGDEYDLTWSLEAAARNRD